MYRAFGARVKTGDLDVKRILDFIQDLSHKEEVGIQLFDARYIFGLNHINSAYQHAKHAMEQNRSISDVLSIEILLYASGEYQIKNALTKVGLREDSTEMAILIMSSAEKEVEDNKCKTLLKTLTSEFKLELDDRVLEGDKEYLSRFGISEDELAAVPEDRWFDLVLEKVALVDIRK